MKKNMILAMVVITVLGMTAAWAGPSEVGAPGTAAVNDINLKINKYCSVAVGVAELTVVDPIAGTANANATCSVATNFNAVIEPEIEPATGYTTDEGEKPDWVWVATIGGNPTKDVAAGQTSETAVNVALSGVALKDVNIPSFTKVATLTVTISEDIEG